MTLAAAGHPAPVIVRATGETETIAARGTILGAVSDPAFEICEVTLGAGDAIVVYSDGILDIAIDGVRVDERRIAELLSGPPGADARALVDRLRDVLPGAHERRDDVAIMALRRTGAKVGAHPASA